MGEGGRKSPEIDGETALALWAEGKSAGEIAAALAAGREPAIRALIALARAGGDPRAVRHPAGSRSPWSAEQIALLTTLWGEGRSSAAIARLMGGGLTRNAVLGKVHRLNLPGRETTQPEPRIRRRGTHARLAPGRAADRAAGTGGRTHAAPGALREKIAFAPPLTPLTPLTLVTAVTPVVLGRPVCAPVTLIARTPRQCGFVIGEPDGAQTWMCGAAKALAEPYCEFHLDIAYAAPPAAWSGARRARFFAVRAGSRAAADLAAAAAAAHAVPQAAPADPPAGAAEITRVQPGEKAA